MLKKIVIIPSTILIIVAIVIASAGFFTNDQDDNEENDKPEYSTACRTRIFKQITNDHTGNLVYCPFFYEYNPEEISNKILNAFNETLTTQTKADTGNQIWWDTDSGRMWISTLYNLEDKALDENELISIRGMFHYTLEEYSEEEALNQSLEIFNEIGDIFFQDDFISVETWGNSISVKVYNTYNGRILFRTGIGITFINMREVTYSQSSQNYVEIYIQPRFCNINDTNENFNESEYFQIAKDIEYEYIRESVWDLYELNNFYFNDSISCKNIEYEIFNNSVCALVDMIYSIKHENLIREYPFDTTSLHVIIYIDIETGKPLYISY